MSSSMKEETCIFHYIPEQQASRSSKTLDQITLYDAFTGKKFDKRLATARAMHRFIRAFIEEGKGRLVRKRDNKPNTSKILDTPAELHNLVHELETSWAKSCKEGEQCLRFHQNEVVHEFEDSSEEDFLEARDYGFPTL